MVSGQPEILKRVNLKETFIRHSVFRAESTHEIEYGAANRGMLMLKLS